MNPRYDDALRAAITRNLAQLVAAPSQAGDLKRAAVCLIVADDGEGGAAVVLTRRAEHLSAHSGQFALPGGRIDEGETVAQAALREAHEEIGLALAPDSILGRLDDYPTRSGYLISPVVAWAPRDAATTANPAEVAAIYRVHFSELNRAGSPEFVAIPESDRPVIRYPLLGTLIHAPTAAVLYQFMEVAVHGRATRVAHLEQPPWAWR
ncbi:MAG TPA: CoA pyrophosphatase [Burkholderiales bacterium]|nr:CoA pyrophosphatase [Burkholderiales bacterium]